VTRLADKNLFVFTNYNDAVKKYDTSGNIADLGGSPPKAKCVCDANGYLLLGNLKDGANLYPEDVAWCDTDDPENWTIGVGSNAGGATLQDGFEITGIVRLGNIWVVGKSDSIWTGYLTGDDRVFQFESVERRLGFISGQTMCVIPGGTLIGLSRSGIITFNGVRAQLVAPGIFDDIHEQANPQRIHLAHAEVVAELNEYWCFIPVNDDLYPCRLYRYNYITGQVYKDKVTSITASGLRSNLDQTTYDDVVGHFDDQNIIYDQIVISSLFPRFIVGDKDGKCYHFDYATENEGGVAIEAYWTSKDLIPFPGYYAHWSEFYFEGLGDEVDVYYSTDEGVTWTFMETLTLTASMASYPIYCDILSEKIRLKFENNDADSTFTMRNFGYLPPAQRESVTA
jgi:hypothetical protein